MMVMFFPYYGRSRQSKTAVVWVEIAHIVVLGLLTITVPNERPMETVRPIAVRLIELAPEALMCRPTRPPATSWTLNMAFHTSLCNPKC
jgi:hypothetical protein